MTTTNAKRLAEPTSLVRSLALPALLALLAWLAAGLPARAEKVRVHEHRDRADWALQKESTLKKTFTLAAAPGGRTVEIDNFDGKVQVGAHGGSEVTLAVHQTYLADSAEKLELGQREVRLDISQTGNRLRLFVDGPFRSRDGGIDFNGWRKLGYEARFDFELEVPADVNLVAHTVEHGDVHVAGVGGSFDISNVNGPVTLERMSGAGSVRSVNGPVQASFTRSPGANCVFKTVNGRVEVSFPADFAADLRFKTLNGEVYTDFPYSYRNLPPDQEEGERSRHGRYHYRSRGEFAARIAAGGPELAFSTINGDILIRRQDR